MIRLIFLSICLLMFLDIYSLTPKDSFKSNSILFTENKGQICDQNGQPRSDVLFNCSRGNLSFQLKNNGVSYQFFRVDSFIKRTDYKTKQESNEVFKQTIYRVDANWINANRVTDFIKDAEVSGYNNYYLEHCPNGVLNVKSYSGVTLKNIYNNIDIHYYQNANELKYDYVVAPHTDYKQIQIEIKGAGVSIDKEGKLRLETEFGNVIEDKPIVFQNHRQLNSRWMLNANVLSFEVENYNPKYELIIDPLTRIWGTYFGGVGGEEGRSCANDQNGNVYLTGSTASSGVNVIATSGVYQSTYLNNGDAYLVKFDGLTNNRIWGTYYGGSGWDVATFCASDKNNHLYFGGITSSTIAISTFGVHQSNYGGGVDDAFLVKFDSLGQRIWGTYLGGLTDDQAYSCQINSLGEIFLAGTTTSSNTISISTPGTHQNSYGGDYDGFLVKFDSLGVRLWGTYYGGINLDRAYSCAIDTLGNVYLAGETGTSQSLVMASAGSHQPSKLGGSDGFLVKFDNFGNRLWGTYYGGAGNEFGISCASDKIGNVYFAGDASTNIGTTIATPGSFQSIFGGGNYDAYIVKFNPLGIRLWGSYLGGTGDDYSQASFVDNYGNFFLSGMTTSANGFSYPTTGTHQQNLGGSYDAFLGKIDFNGICSFITYYGGVSDDYGYSCSSDNIGNIYLAGNTLNSDSIKISTMNSFQNSYGGSGDAFLVKFNEELLTNYSLLNNQINNFTVYPNPSSTVFNIKSDISVDVDIYDNIGRVIYSSKVKKGVNAIDLTSQKSGIYFIRVNSDNYHETIKIIKN